MDKQEEILSALQTLISKFDSPQHEEEHQYIRLAMTREAKKSKLYDAIIEKSLASLAWSVLVGIGTAVFMYIKDHIK